MTPPIIIIGMHRSGTTMVTDLLQKLGLYLGWVLQENSEALFFVERNEALLNACGGGWEFPEPVENLLNHAGMRERAARELRRDMESVSFLSYLGPRHILARGNLSKLNCAWGWKDPRNSFLLPLWLDLFPDARVIHIYRHPMDVARSLYVRENRVIERRLARLAGQPAPSTAGTAGNSNRSFHRERGLLYLYRRFLAARSRFAALSRYSLLRVPATASLQAGLKLWAAYVGRCVAHTEALKAQALSLKYEDFLDRPADHLERLRVFCGLPGNDEVVGKICKGVQAERRYAFLKDPKACLTFEAFKEHPLVRKLEYDDVCSGKSEGLAVGH